MDRSPRLVGRDAEVAALEAEWRHSCTGHLRCVLVVGDPGAGKTRLVEDFSAYHAGRSLLAARGRRLSAGASFGVWAEALQEPLRLRPTDRIVESCGGALRDLSGLFSHISWLRAPVPCREPPRIRLMHSLGTLLTVLAERRPRLIFLDDMHLADASSWELLEYLALHCADAAALIVVATQQSALAEQPAAKRAVAELGRHRALCRVDLVPLDSAALRQLSKDALGRSTGEHVMDWVRHRSRGNVLEAVGLLCALRAQGGEPPPSPRRLPEGLPEQVGRRVRTLDEDARRLLEVLVIADGSLPLEKLIDFGGGARENVARALGRLIDARLVTRHAQRHHHDHQVVHPAVADAIYAGMPSSTRAVLHGVVGRRILLAGQLGEAALHFARSADTGDGEAIEVLVQALRQAEERGSCEEALIMLGALARILPSTDERRLRVAGMLNPGHWTIDHCIDLCGSAWAGGVALAVGPRGESR